MSCVSGRIPPVSAVPNETRGAVDRRFGGRTRRSDDETDRRGPPEGLFGDDEETNDDEMTGDAGPPEDAGPPAGVGPGRRRRQISAAPRRGFAAFPMDRSR
ncbi:hypothetical protein BRD17_03135 [Halobacteriales archaeon SW_7_68_16]|nr:MAG: hypothetical protein BRD17_03135 [Halobacteriales archaeon SW_7_68_16]